VRLRENMGTITSCTSKPPDPDPVPAVVEPVRMQYPPRQAPVHPRQMRNLEYNYNGNPYIPPANRVDPELLKTTGYNEIWNQYGWLDYEDHESNNPDVFHAKVDDYIFILQHTPGLDVQAIWRVNNFLKSRHLYPLFRPPSGGKREQNYYRIMWYILHSLPFYIREYNQQTCRAISDFFMDVAITHPCNVCADHFEKYQKDNPWVGRGLSDLVVWLCNLHNHLNTRLGKPWFDCTKYAKRWGIQIETIRPRGKPTNSPAPAADYNMRKPLSPPLTMAKPTRRLYEHEEKNPNGALRRYPERPKLTAQTSLPYIPKRPKLTTQTSLPYIPKRQQTPSPDYKPSPSPPSRYDHFVPRRQRKREVQSVPMFPE
jgi:hypothetical protein